MSTHSFLTPLGRIDAFALEEEELLTSIKIEPNNFSLNGGERWELSPFWERVETQFIAYFEGRCTQFSLPYRLEGSPFQQSVWRALTQIPYGALLSYQEVANMIDAPTAVRAVANAIGLNPLPLLIPCHRVIRSSGALGGYRWGIELKSALLQLEKQHNQ